jgi:hypothetical protein
MFRIYSGAIQEIRYLELFMTYSGNIQELFRRYSGKIQIYWRYTEDNSCGIQEIFKIYSGYILKAFRKFRRYYA